MKALLLGAAFVAKLTLFLIVVGSFGSDKAKTFIVFSSIAQLLSILQVGVPALTKNQFVQGELSEREFASRFATAFFIPGAALLLFWVLWIWGLGATLFSDDPGMQILGFAYGVYVLQCNTYALFSEARSNGVFAYRFIALSLVFINLLFLNLSSEFATELAVVLTVLSGAVVFLGTKGFLARPKTYLYGVRNNPFLRVELTSVPVGALEIPLIAMALTSSDVVAYALCQRVFGVLPALSAALTRPVWSVGAIALRSQDHERYRSVVHFNRRVMWLGVLGVIICVAASLFLIQSFVAAGDISTLFMVAGFGTWAAFQLANRKSKNLLLAADHYKSLARALSWMNLGHLSILAMLALFGAPLVVWVVLKVISAGAAMIIMRNTEVQKTQ
ncbi:MAG: hypothetical protein AAGG55_05715 [Pseudomonadota bacterium]